MSYSRRPGRNWGVLIACTIAMPLMFLWFVAVFVGGALVCAGPGVRCASSLLALLEGFAVVAVGATALGWSINRVIGALERLR